MLKIDFAWRLDSSGSYTEGCISREIKMSTFVFVHGAGLGGWCWYKVVPLLEHQGHRVIALDLPSHGKDKTPTSKVSLSAYVDRVCQCLDEQPEPVILVGHSMGGGINTQVAEDRPDAIQTLVYLAGYLLSTGESMLDIIEADTESLLLDNAIFSADRLSVTFKESALKAVGFGDCSDEDMALIRSLMVPQATSPLITPVSTTVEHFGRVPRVYIECLRDRTLGPLTQKKLYSALPCDRIISLDTSHSPFFSAPQSLADALLSLTAP
jgi:pimeloyl-ACP methyl ester carboxylesterase